ncbi:MAG: ComEC/Rec2 family competence protein [Patescibacteria group bacterium]
MPLNRTQSLSLLFLIFLLFVNSAVYVLLYREEHSPKLLTVSFLDIGQGDSIFIETPGGRQMLIDGGRDARVLRELSGVMSPFDKDIDVVIATHPDADHIGGLIDVLGKYKIGTLLESPAEGKTATYRTLKNLVEEKNIPEVLAEEGGEILFDYGIIVEVLSPPIGTSPNTETNTASIVIKVTYGENEFLLTADAPRQVEHRLVTGKKDLVSDVLKAGHHGSRTSSSNEFVEAVNPEHAVVSSGKSNSYGHPHKETLDTFSKHNIKILRTDERGRITFYSDSKTLSVDKGRSVEK